MLTIESVKKLIADMAHYVDDWGDLMWEQDDQEALEWLVGEVERLNNEVHEIHQGHRDLIREAVSRCVEIVISSCLVPPDGGSPSVEEVGRAEYVVELIRREFAIAKAEGGN